MTDLTQPHDRFFKVLFSDPATAGAFLRERLPPEVAALLAPELPEPVEGTFVSEKLRPYYSDRLFRAKLTTGRQAFCYALIEHKSYLDQQVAYQLGRGIWGILEQAAAADPEWTSLPPVIPLILYHGKKEWHIPREFLGIVEADEALRPWLLNFPFTVVNLAPLPDWELSAYARLRTGLMVLKYGTKDTKTQNAALADIAAALMDVPELLIPVILYMMATFAGMDQKTIEGIVIQVAGQEGPRMMSIAAREWWDEGKKEGKDEGIKEGKASTLLHFMRRRFGEIPAEVEKHISQAKIPKLEQWLDRILDARSLDEVFKE